MDKKESLITQAESNSLRLTEDLHFQEKHATKQEDKISSLEETLEKSTNNVAILKKNLGQKNKHIAILLKEKQRLTDEKYRRDKK